MKKLLFISMMLLAMTTVSAQKWTKKIVEADAMKGQVEKMLYEWSNTDCTFIMAESDNSWMVTGGAFKPDPTHVNHRSNFETYGKVGFYDNDDNLLESWDNCKFELTNFYRTAGSAASKKKKGQYALPNYLRNKTGYVRIIIPLINGDDFDVTIPCLNNDN